jgi:hypothetical protein
MKEMNRIHGGKMPTVVQFKVISSIFMQYRVHGSRTKTNGCNEIKKTE